MNRVNGPRRRHPGERHGPVRIGLEAGHREGSPCSQSGGFSIVAKILDFVVTEDASVEEHIVDRSDPWLARDIRAEISNRKSVPSSSKGGRLSERLRRIGDGGRIE